MEEHTINGEILINEEPALQGNLVTQVRRKIAMLEKELVPLKEYLRQSEHISQMLRGGQMTALVFGRRVNDGP